jgi:hypothetical protein
MPLILEKAIELVVSALLKYLFSAAGDAVKHAQAEKREKDAIAALIAALVAADSEAAREKATDELARGSWIRRLLP